MKKILLAATALLALSATTPAGAQDTPPKRACLRQDDIYNWTALNDRTLVVEDLLHRKYKLTLIGTCYDLKFHEVLAFKVIGSAGLGIACVSPGDLVITRNFASGPTSCAITSIKYYTPEEEAADKAAAAAAKAAGHGSD